MKTTRIRLPFLLDTNAYFGVVVLLTILWAASDTVKNAVGFSWVVLLVGTGVIVNGVANIILEQDEYSNLYQLKAKDDILSAKNGANYLSLLWFLTIARFWFTASPLAGPLLFVVLVGPLFLAITYVLASEVKSLFTKGFSSFNTVLGFALLFYTVGNGLRYTIADAFGEERIGSFFEKSEYTTQYYVNLFPEKNDAQNYRLPADIHVYSEEEEGEESSSTKKCIRLEKVYFPNNGFVNFSDDGEDKNLTFGQKVYVADQHNKGWYVELVDEKVK